MEKGRMTTQFAEIYGAMPYSKRVEFQRQLLNLENTPIAVPAINRWFYSLSTPNNDIKIMLVANVLRKMGYEVNHETLFEKYEKAQEPAGETVK